MSKIKEIWKYRYMLYTLLKQDLLGKYKKSILGILWVWITPIIQLIIYILTFQYIFNIQIENYPMYLFIGIMGWNMFSSSVSYGVGSIVRNSSIVKKIFFPKEVLPMSVLIGHMINYILSLPVIIIGLYISGIGLSWYALLLPIVLVIQLLFSYAITLVLSAINVYIRDVEHLLGSVMFIWLYITPVIYSKEMVPEVLLKFYNLNPMLYIIEAYRSILFYKQCFDIVPMIILLVVSTILVIISEVIFSKLQKRFAEEM